MENVWGTKADRGVCLCAIVLEEGHAVWRMHVQEGDLGGEGEWSSREGRVGAADGEKKRQEKESQKESCNQQLHVCLSPLPLGCP